MSAPPSVNGPGFDRRQFLRGTVGLTAATAVVTLGGACTTEVTRPIEGLHTFNLEQGATMSALAATVLQGLPGLDSLDEVVLGIDAALSLEPDALQSKVRDAVLFLEWTPQFSLKLRPFSALEPDDRSQILSRFAVSPLKIKRTVYNALTGMILFAYADNPATWEGSGYDGPWVGRPVLGTGAPAAVSDTP